MTICSTLLENPTFTAEEKAWIEKLMSPEYGQSHLFEKLSHPAGVKRLLAEIDAADKVYPGGLKNYVTRARKLLADSKAGVNSFEGYTPKTPLGENLITGTSAFCTFEELGLQELDKVAFVLVAGGLGERLGYPGIKISLPIETVTGMTYAEYYIRMILACETYVERITGKRPKLPLAIMTSEDTHTATVRLLEENDRFGLPKDQLTIMKQEKVPALMDNEARFAVKPQDPYSLETKPHGHGDIHTLLNQYGLPRQWVNEGRRWMFLFQDTNGLVSHALAPLLGVSKKHNLTMNSLTVPRVPGEAMGAICKLEKKDSNESLTINVEYNQLAPLMVASGLEGDVADPATGYSRFPGNTNVLVFQLSRYADILEATGGAVPEFVNPKYADNSKTSFKSPTRLECMMQDLPRLFDKSDHVGSTQLDRWLCFSTVKNNVTDAAAKARSGGPPDCAFTGESDIFYANAKLLQIAGKDICTSIDIAERVSTTYLDIPYKLGPKVVILPSFGIALQQIKERLRGGRLRLAPKATVVLDGDVELNGLDVDGAVILKSACGKQLVVENLVVRNQGVQFVPLNNAMENVPAALQIRGYKTEKLDATRLSAM